MTDGIDLDRLEALAANATPGPWRNDRGYVACARVDEWEGVTIADAGRPNADFIAALDPDTVRALIARVREAEAKIEQVRAILDDEPECAEHPDSDPVTCGWKYDIRRIRGVMEESTPATEHVRARQQPVEITDDMVERAAKVISNAPFPSARSLSKARAALKAALGGGPTWPS